MYIVITYEIYDDADGDDDDDDDDDDDEDDDDDADADGDDDDYYYFDDDYDDHDDDDDHHHQQQQHDRTWLCIQVLAACEVEQISKLISGLLLELERLRRIAHDSLRCSATRHLSSCNLQPASWLHTVKPSIQKPRAYQQFLDWLNLAVQKLILTELAVRLWRYCHATINLGSRLLLKKLGLPLFQLRISSNKPRL